jgi:hypothetical protein
VGTGSFPTNLTNERETQGQRAIGLLDYPSLTESDLVARVPRPTTV